MNWFAIWFETKQSFDSHFRFDRHLFGLKYMAEKHNIQLDPIYESDAYRKLNYNILSTSSLAADSLMAGSFGPVIILIYMKN